MSDFNDPFANQKLEFIDPFAQPDNKPEESKGSFIQDLGVSWGIGSNQLLNSIGTAYGLITGDTDNAATRLAKSNMEYYRDRKSSELKELERNRAEAIDSSDSVLEEIGAAVWNTVKEPRLLASFIVEQVPMTVGAGGTGAAAKGVSSALGAGSKATAIGTGTAVAAGATLQGADVGGQAYEQLMTLPQEVWEKNEDYQSLVSELGIEEAKKELALDYSRKAALASSAISVGSQFVPGGKTIEKYFSGGKSSTSGLNKVSKGAVGEALQEAIEEGGGNVLSNTAVQTVDESQSLTEGLGESIGLGALGGGLMGAATSSGTRTDTFAQDKRELEQRIEQAKRIGQELLETNGTAEQIQMVQESLDKLEYRYNQLLKANDPNFVDAVSMEADVAKQQVAKQGGDALDQSLAAADVMTNIPDAVAGEQAKNAIARVEGQKSKVWEPNFTMPDQEVDSPIEVSGDYISKSDYPESVPLGNQLEFDPSVDSIKGEKEQLKQLDYDPVIYGEDKRESRFSDVNFKPSGQPFPTKKSVIISRSYRDAVEKGLETEIIDTGSGFGFRILESNDELNENNTDNRSRSESTNEETSVRASQRSRTELPEQNETVDRLSEAETESRTLDDGRVTDDNALDDVTQEFESKVNLQTPVADSSEYHSKIADQAYSHSNRYGGRVAKESYVNFINENYEALNKDLNPEQKQILDNEFVQLKQDYMEQERTVLRQREDVVSSHIAGKSNFNAKSANKRGSALDKAENKFTEWTQGRLADIKVKLENAENEQQKLEKAEYGVKKENKKLVSDFASAVSPMNDPGMNKTLFMTRARKSWERLKNANPDEATKTIQTMNKLFEEQGTNLKSVIGGRSQLWKDIDAFTSDAGNSTEDVQLTPTQEGKYRVYMLTASALGKPDLSKSEFKAQLPTMEAEQKIKDLNVKADKLSEQAISDLKNVPPGQPVLSSVDRNKRDRSGDKMAKANALRDKANELQKQLAQDGVTENDETFNDGGHIKRYDSLIERINNADGKLSVSDLQNEVKTLVENEQAVKEELSKLTKEQLLKYYNGYHDSSLNNPQLVESSFDDMVNQFRFYATKSDFITSSHNPFTKSDPTKRFSTVEGELTKLSDEDFQDIIQSRKKERDERIAERAAKLAGIRKPNTLDDFMLAYRNGLSSEWTNNQWATFDRLISDNRIEKQKERNKREVTAFEGEVNYTLNESVHSKKGFDLFIVSLDERLDKDRYRDLNNKAKQLGGYYSSYNKQGAIPGFQFKTEENRQQFLQIIAGENVEKTKKPKDKTDSLLDMADRMEERAREELDRPRLTNTARRADMAAGSLANAEAELQQAKELRTIASAIKDGKVKYLAKLSTKTELELLGSLWNQMFYSARGKHRDNDEANSLVERYNSGPYTKYRWKSDVTAEDKVRLAEYPLSTMSEYQLREISQGMTNTKGYSLAGKAFKKLHEEALKTDKPVFVKNNKYFDKMIEFVRKHSDREYIQEVAKDYQRLQRMGIETLPMLRTALIEYDKITSEVEQETTSNATTEALKYADLKGKYKDNDFFNSTKVVVDEVMEYANLESGMKVLEPSAGVGHLADGAAYVVGVENVDTGELAHELQGFLKDKGYNVEPGDFLEREPNALYDRVIMNPPFSKDQEITHVEHAYKFLKPGGRLIAVTSVMAGERSNKRNKSFREWLESMGAEEINLPEGAFKDAINPTNVNSKIIVIDKPIDAEEETNPKRAILFSKSKYISNNDGSQSSTADKRAQFEKRIGQFIQQYTGAFTGITIENSPVDIFGLEQTERQGAKFAPGAYDPQTDKLFLFIDNIPTEEQLVKTLRHELIVHRGLGLFSEDKQTDILKAIHETRSSSDKRIKEIWSKIDSQYQNDPDSIKAEEFLAKLSESELPKQTWIGKQFREMVRVITEALSKLGIIEKPTMSYSEMQDVIRDISEALAEGQLPRKRNLDKVQFSKGGFSVPEETLAHKFIRNVQDKFLPIKRLQKSIEAKNGKPLNNASNVYQAEELFYGKAENDLTGIEDKFLKPLVSSLKENDLSIEELDLYLYASHAKERNAYIASINEDLQDGGSGMTNAEADRILKAFASEGKTPALIVAAQKAYAITKERKNIIRDAGLEEDALVDIWDANYENYVPLKGYAADSESQNKARIGRGFDIRGKESMKALGRRSLAESPLMHAIEDLTATVIRKRKNEVGKSFLNLVQENPNPDFWDIFTDEEPDYQRSFDQRTGQVVTRPISMRDKKDDYFAVKQDGQTYYVKVKDPRVLAALQNLGPVKSNWATQSIGKVTRFLSMVNTSLNPEFMVTNALRDIQTAAYNALAEQSLTDGKVKDQDLALDMAKGAWPSMNVIRKYYRNIEPKSEGEKLDRQYFEEFLEDGAKTGYFDSKDINEIEKQINEMLQMENGSFVGKSKKGLKAITDFVEDYNSAVENGVRLSAYVEARKRGINRPKSASFAKNLTVNFNRKGEIGNALNAFYMFANASIQGTANFARAILVPKETEKGYRLNSAQKMAGVIMASAAGLAYLNRQAAGEDDDEINYYDKVPGYVKERNMVMMKSLWGGEPGEYIKIPLPYGYNIFYVLGESMEAYFNSTDKQRRSEIIGDIIGAMAGSFSPIGTHAGDNTLESIFLTATPTVALPFAEVGFNTNYFGSEIYRENYDFGPQKANSALSNRNTIQAYRDVATWLNEATGGTDYRPGWVDISPDVLEHMVEFGLGGLYRFSTRTYDAANRVNDGLDIKVTQTPFIRNIQGEITPYGDISRFYDARQELKNIEAELKSLKGEERVLFLQEFRDKRKLKNVMSSVDKRMKFLRKRRDLIEEDESLSRKEREAKLERIEEQMSDTVLKFNKLWDKAA